ncbi:ABC transporter ATP-binding protein [Saccharothrix violaceirubra]|uniref:ABC-2 type transport system ATP-binding protein n=1 Tax=Saccharothrix violaceirubra TaxID=413306 RepID=A0A7W7WUP6_9PSEU|nr:ATP-binding cassette domain-containing protein [Saccharothrix violaceirubra]MBB4964489.1 ABC-2 type transport system ATP-binding protein [Saccharothrix violaceirubra]
MIEVVGLTKVYQGRNAVDDLSFQVRPGVVTGFLGPNGAGKSTTMRLILGLDRPTSGSATVNGHAYRDFALPLREVGALLDARSAHPGRSARDHLRILATANGIPAVRVDEVLDLVGLHDVGRKRIKTFSLGMTQRFGLAVALLGDPPVLLLDEPLNGLDVEGVHWMRNLLREFAEEGRTVLVSSHLMSEVQGTAKRVVVIGGGRLIADTDTRTFIESTVRACVLVETPCADKLTATLESAGATVERAETHSLRVHGLSRRQVGELALGAGVVLYSLGDEGLSLEDAFLSATNRFVDYRTSGGEYRA